MRQTWGRTAVLTLLVLLVAYPPLRAQTEAEWLAPIDGDWSDASRWSTDPTVPNGVGFDALFDATGTPYVATIDQDVTLQQMTIDSPDATVLLDGGTLSVPGGITINQGELRLLNNGKVYNTRIDGPGHVTTQRDYVNREDFLALHNVTLATTLRGHEDESSYLVLLRSELELDGGVVELGGGLDLRLYLSMGITGTGEVIVPRGLSVYNPEAEIYLHGGSQDDYFIGPGVALRALDSWLDIFGSGNFTNHGLIEATGPQGEIDIDDSVSFINEGTLRVADGALLNIENLAPGAKVGNLDIGSGSAIHLKGTQADPVTNVVYEFDQPVTIPDGAELRVDGDWENNTTLTFDGGTFRVGSNGNSPGNLVFQNGATISIGGLLDISRLAELGSTPTTHINFQSPSLEGRSLILEQGTWDLNSIPGQWDLTTTHIQDGTLTGLPNGNNIAQETDSVTFNDVNLDLPLVLSAGRAFLVNTSSIQQPATIAGGTLWLRDEWTNSGGITMTSGVLDLKSLPDSLGTIDVLGGTVNLYGFPLNPSDIQFQGGTLSVDFDTTLLNLRASLWTPQQVTITESLDLEATTLDLGADTWTWSTSDSGEIRNGVITDEAGAGILVMDGGRLRDVTLRADLLADDTVSLYGQMQIDGSHLTGTFFIRNDTHLTLNDVSIDGLLTFQRYTTGGEPVVISGLTGAGEVQLNTRLVTMSGTQTIDGSIEFITDGIRHLTGGGIQAVGGDLTFGPDITFHSRRSGSLLLAEQQNLINDGTIIAGVDSYTGSYDDTLGPSITIRASSFIQRGTIQVTDGQKVHVDTTYVFNEGLIDLQDSGVMSLTGNYIQTATGVLDVEIGEASLGDELDRLLVDGQAYLGGALNVRLAGGFLPEFGDEFTILSATTGITGDFSSVLLPELGEGLWWSYMAEPNAITLAVMGSTIPGDANGDGMVDGFDYLIWAANFGDNPADDPPGSPLNGDFDDDGKVDGFDYLVWAVNFGTGTATSVPEPGAGLLLVLGLVAMLVVRRR